MENDMPEAMKAAIASMEPFLIVPDPNVFWVTQNRSFNSQLTCTW
jgi:hypothetical protein